jgi:sugar fermentation stimulation protein A
MPNPGRMKELLLPDAQLLLERRSGKQRSTEYKVVGVWYARQWVSLDSTRGNAEVRRLIEAGRLEEFAGYEEVRPEATYGSHRYDLRLEGPKGSCLVEVKSCTLVEGGLGRFPDAPTKRGASHMRGLREAVDEGLDAAVVIFIPRRDVRRFRPNDETDPAFGSAFQEAVRGGVRPLALRFSFDGTGMRFLGRVPVES